MSRARALGLLIDVLGPTSVGRDLGLSRLDGLEDFRSALPVMDPQAHERDVERRLGFGVLDDDDPRAKDLALGTVERDAVVSVWQAERRRAPRRIALLRGNMGEPAWDRIATEDLDAFAAHGEPGEAPTLVIDNATNRERVHERLVAFDPDVLIVPSAMTCAWLEAVDRRPLERTLRALRLVLAEHDVAGQIRSAVPLRAAGWIGRSGRLALPSLRGPRRAVVLAMGSQVIELLPYSNPEEDGRRVYAERTILPEEAVVGMRYELVVSSALGYIRMRTDEHVRVVGFDPPSEHFDGPRPRMVRLAPAPMDVRLEGCTVAGAWLTACIRQSLLREDPALVGAEVGPDPQSMPRGAAAFHTGSMALPSAFKETELAWLAKTGAHKVERKLPRGLLVRVELQGYVTREMPQMLSDRIDASLQRRSPAYAYLREREELRPPRVIVLKTGTRRSEEDRRIRELLGPVRVPDTRVVER